MLVSLPKIHLHTQPTIRQNQNARTAPSFITKAKSKVLFASSPSRSSIALNSDVSTISAPRPTPVRILQPHEITPEIHSLREAIHSEMTQIQLTHPVFGAFTLNQQTLNTQPASELMSMHPTMHFLSAYERMGLIIPRLQARLDTINQQRLDQTHLTELHNHNLQQKLDLLEQARRNALRPAAPEIPDEGFSET